MHVLYVYGTLRTDGVVPSEMVPGTLFDLGWYPGARLLPPEAGVHFFAERMVVDDARLREIDDYEGYDPKFPEESLYIRKPYKDGWIYEYNDTLTDQHPVIKSGDWCEYYALRTHRATPVYAPLAVGIGHNGGPPIDACPNETAWDIDVWAREEKA